MLKRFTVSGIVLAALLFSPPMYSQTAQPKSPEPTEPGLDGWGRPITPPRKIGRQALLHGMIFPEFGIRRR